jgi:hypothetical protein
MSSDCLRKKIKRRSGFKGLTTRPLSQSDTPTVDTRIATMPSQREQVIKQAHERIARIRSDLNAMDYFSSGTLLQRTKICGNPRCRCAQGPEGRHGPYYQWGHMKGGKLVHRTVSPQQAAILRLAIANYRKAKKLMKAWEDETERLMDLEAAHKS